MEGKRINIGNLGMRKLAEYGYNQPTVSQFAMYKEPYIYNKEKIILGRNVLDGELVKLKTKKTFRMFNYGPSGTGKTVFTERVVSEFLSNNEKHRAAVLTDVKPEYYSMAETLQEKYRKFLKKEDPRGFPCVSYYPKFLYNRNRLPKTHTVSQLDPSRLSVSDLLNFLRDEITINQIAELERAMKNGIPKSYPEVEKLLQSTESLGARNNRTISSLFYSLFVSNEILGKKHTHPDFVSDIAAGKVPILNTYDFEGMSANYQHYVNCLVAYFVEDIKRGMMDKLRGLHVLEVVSETNWFMPKNADTIAKAALNDVLSKGRSRKNSWIGDAQNIENLDVSILKNCNWLVYSVNSETDDVVRLLDAFCPSALSDQFYRRGIRKENAFYREQYGDFCKVLVSRNGRVIKPFISAMPLHRIVEEGDA